MTTFHPAGNATTTCTPLTHCDHHVDDLITVAELAQLLRLPVATLRYWRHLGTGPRGFRIGHHVRYYRADVEHWLQQRHDNDDGTA